MNARERLRGMVRYCPEGSALTVPVAVLAELLAEIEEGGEAPRGAPEIEVDLTVPQVAKLLGRKASTVRGWVAAGRIEGAYLFRDREWRVPRPALEAFMVGERTRLGGGGRNSAVRSIRPRRGVADLSAWRRVK